MTRIETEMDWFIHPYVFIDHLILLEHVFVEHMLNIDQYNIKSNK